MTLDYPVPFHTPNLVFPLGTSLDILEIDV